MPAERELDRQKLRARARRKMGLWALGSGCMVVTALYGSALAHREAQAPASATNDCPKLCAGYSPTLSGSCWCGLDTYCMCTPSLAIDTVVEITSPATGEVESVLVVRRKDNGKLSCIGGFVEVGETLESAVKREVLEETGLTVTDLWMMPRVYDNPVRDARRHTVSVAYVVRVAGVPRPGKEEQAVVSIPLGNLRHHLDGFAFDHDQILDDYLALD